MYHGHKYPMKCLLYAQKYEMLNLGPSCLLSICHMGKKCTYQCHQVWSSVVLSPSKLWISVASNIQLFACILYRCLSRWSCATSGKIPGSDGELESEKGRFCLPQTFPILLTKVNDFKVNDPKNSGTFTYFHHSISSNSHIALWPFFILAGGLYIHSYFYLSTAATSLQQ